MTQILGGHYQIERQLAVGGFGRTFLARDTHLPDRPLCVIKQLKTAFSHPQEIQVAQRLFDQEAKTLYALGEHPQIPKLLAHFEENQSFYLAQEFVQGQPLSELIVPGAPWPEERVLALLQDMLQVLTFVHYKQVIHRDIKPANLLWRQDDERIVLIDFGAVKAHQPGHTAIANSGQNGPLTVAIGTSGYMPVEQSSGRPKLNSDLYATGMVALEALTGLRITQLVAHSETGEIDWRQHAPHTNSDVADFLDHMVRYDWRQRFKDAGEAITALRKLPSQPLSAVATTGYLPPTILSETPKVASNSPQEQATSPNPPDKTEKQRDQLPRFLTQPVTAIALAAIASIGLLAVGSNLSGRLFNSSQSAPQASTVSAPSENRESSSESNSQVDGETDVERAERLAEQAQNSYDEGNYELALSLFTEAQSLGLNTADVAWGRCLSLDALDRDEGAREACAEAASIPSNSVNAVSFLTTGMAEMGQSRYQRALALFNQAERLQPDNEVVWVGQGIALTGLEEFEQAVAVADRGLEQKPDVPELWVVRGNALLQLDNAEEALKSSEQALALRPNMPEALTLQTNATAAL